MQVVLNFFKSVFKSQGATTQLKSLGNYFRVQSFFNIQNKLKDTLSFLSFNTLGCERVIAHCLKKQAFESISFLH